MEIKKRKNMRIEFLPKRKFRQFPLLIIILVSLFSCHKEPDIQTQVDITDYCPKCSDEISWDNFGRWRIGGVGYDGNYGNGIPTHIETTCGWKIHNGHAGGVGDTYQVRSEECGTSVVFEWAYGGFASFYLGNGWTGSTKEGIKLGDDLDTFLSVYPEFEVSSSNDLQYEFSNSNRRIRAIFNSENKLKNLFIKRY